MTGLNKKTPPSEIWPPALLHNAVLVPLFVSAEGVEVSQSGGRLSVVNQFMRWVCVAQTFVFLFSFLSPFYTYWTSPFHYATWRAMLPAVMATYEQIYWVDLLMLLVAALFYWMYVVYCNLSGVELKQRDSTAKAAGRTRLLSELDLIEIIKGQPDLFDRRYTVRLQWRDEQNLSLWQKLRRSMEPKTSFLGVFRLEANADKVAAAIAEFANVPVQHRTR